MSSARDFFLDRGFLTYCLKFDDSQHREGHVVLQIWIGIATGETAAEGLKILFTEHQSWFTKEKRRLERGFSPIYKNSTCRV